MLSENIFLGIIYMTQNLSFKYMNSHHVYIGLSIEYYKTIWDSVKWLNLKQCWFSSSCEWRMTTLAILNSQKN